MGTRIVYTARLAPVGNQWQEALDIALKASLPGKVAGVGTYAPTGVIIIIMDGGATADDDNTALALIAGHDTNTRTPAQQAKAALTTDFDDVMARYLAGNLHSKTPAEIYALIQGQVDGWASLADAKAGLRVILPFLAAVAQVYLREKQG